MRRFVEANLAEFWKDSDYAREEYVLPSLTISMIENVQDRLGYRLPSAYIELMRFQNGGIPKKSAFPTATPTSWAENHVALSGIMGIGDEKVYSLCGELGSQFMIAEWGYPPIGVYFGNCPSAGHDMICLDYRKCGPSGDPAVVHVDQENDHTITHLADNFETFIGGLVDAAQFDEVEDQHLAELIWHADSINAHIQRDDEFLRIGQYLHLSQTLSPTETGWLNMKLSIPEHWSVHSITLRNGVVCLQTDNAGMYCLTRDNVGGLSFELLEGGHDNSDDLLQAVWSKHAAIDD
ncbi:SMI1 / KNR4 family (SUKH-1) [Aliiroseovarius halocynthiae]|uniref:SMI1/KNR4 family protein n=1 Tax=Aliiroseovarius halocynthiae TaxID=985055 RepID=A0A545SP65_9RHOB|nr:SMI1/KNR4 family protein [Aliiroseovarius halocynthiae]TQV66744.1 SMI1/KNR4 family protein [Aliiroseovarius halocynthiae]SMR82431.1 SMI1 / KNR4 family (SUKH-1) [Aliiroseovarius halocynthiae]